MVIVKGPEHLYDFSPFRLEERKGSCRLSTAVKRQIRRSGIMACSSAKYGSMKFYESEQATDPLKRMRWVGQKRKCCYRQIECQRFTQYDCVRLRDPFSLAWIVNFFISEISSVLWILCEHERWHTALGNKINDFPCNPTCFYFEKLK